MNWLFESYEAPSQFEFEFSNTTVQHLLGHKLPTNYASRLGHRLLSGAVHAHVHTCTPLGAGTHPTTHLTARDSRLRPARAVSASVERCTPCKPPPRPRTPLPSPTCHRSRHLYTAAASARPFHFTSPSCNCKAP